MTLSGDYVNTSDYFYQYLGDSIRTIVDPVYSWHLQRSEDKYKNLIDYKYTSDASDALAYLKPGNLLFVNDSIVLEQNTSCTYLSKSFRATEIVYGKNISGGGIESSVKFAYKYKGLNWPKYLADGVDVQNDYILDSITVYHNNNRNNFV